MIGRKALLLASGLIGFNQGLVQSAVPSTPPNFCIEGTNRCAQAPTASGGAVKWHPGHYILSDGVMLPGQPGFTNSAIAFLPKGAVGWEQVIAWSALEPSRGNYDFTQFDALLAACKANGKRLVIQLSDRSFVGSGTVRLPAYLASEPNGGGGWAYKTSADGKSAYGIIAKIWLPAIMDREIALYKAIAARYDSDPYFEGVFTSETDPGQGAPGTSDYSSQDHITQLKRFIAEVVPVFPHSNVWENMNFLPTGQADAVDFVAYMFAHRAGLTSPDVKVTGAAGMGWGPHVSTGYTWNGSAWVTGGVNYVGRMSLAMDVEDVDMGGSVGSASAQDFYDQVYQQNQVNHLFWSRKNYPLGTKKQLYYDNSAVSTSSDPAAGRYPQDIKTFIAAGNAPLHTGCPTFYTEGCNSN